MTRRLPPLNWLRSFEAAARHLSFTEAAEELNLTQTAVSQHVKLLEQFLQQPLFQRLPRSLRLTESGKTYAPRVAKIFDQLNQTTDDVFGRRGVNSLSIRVNAAFSVLWLGARLERFTRAFPDVDLRVINPIWPVNLIEDEVDLEVRYGTGNWPGLATEPLTQDKLFPVAAPIRPDSSPPLDKPSDLLAHRLISVIGYASGWPQWLGAAGLTTESPELRLQCDNSIMAFEAAKSGVGVALGRDALVGDLIAQGQLVAPFDLAIETEEQFYLAYPASKLLSAEAAAFRTWILDEAPVTA